MMLPTGRTVSENVNIKISFLKPLYRKVCFCISASQIMTVESNVYIIDWKQKLRPPLFSPVAPTGPSCGAQLCSVCWRVSNYQRFLEEKQALNGLRLHSKCLVVSRLTASNYKSSTSYFNQLDQQVDGVYFWPATNVSFMNPMVPSPGTKEGEPGTTATNQKCTLTQNLQHCSLWVPLSLQQLGLGKAAITVDAMWRDSDV